MLNINVKTERLVLNTLSLDDAAFIFELLNTPQWIQFIGDRNIRTIENANQYIQSVIDGNVIILVVRLVKENLPIGIISFIKRDYLLHYDIGFAFLPGYEGKGFAHEGASAVLNEVMNDADHNYIHATTVKDNEKSIRLLEKLGLKFDKQIQVENEELLLYTIATNKTLIDDLIIKFFAVFDNRIKEKINFEIIHQLCLPQIIIVKKSGLEQEVYNLQTFIEPRKKLLTDGTLNNFYEEEIYNKTKIIGHIATRYSKYKKTGNLNGVEFTGYGNKFFQLVKTISGWKISAVVWEDEN